MATIIQQGMAARDTNNIQQGMAARDTNKSPLNAFIPTQVLHTQHVRSPNVTAHVILYSRVK